MEPSLTFDLTHLGDLTMNVDKNGLWSLELVLLLVHSPCSRVREWTAAGCRLSATRWPSLCQRPGRPSTLCIWTSTPARYVALLLFWHSTPACCMVTGLGESWDFAPLKLAVCVCVCVCESPCVCVYAYGWGGDGVDNKSK